VYGVEVDVDYRTVHRVGCTARVGWHMGGGPVRPATIEDVCGMGMCTVCLPQRYFGLSMKVHRQHRAKERMLHEYKQQLQSWFGEMLQKAGIEVHDRELTGEGVHKVSMQVQRIEPRRPTQPSAITLPDDFSAVPSPTITTDPPSTPASWESLPPSPDCLRERSKHPYETSARRPPSVGEGMQGIKKKPKSRRPSVRGCTLPEVAEGGQPTLRVYFCR
jgi:hypothetical protein